MSRFEHHRTPLHLAVLKNRPAMVQLLLELGADPRARDNRGYTPLNLAKPQTDPAIADLLLAAGAQPTERNVNRFEHLAPTLNVGSVARSVDYYVQKLGFQKMFDWGDPATFASNRSRSHVQKVTTLCPCSGTTSHLIAGGSGKFPALATFSRKRRNSFKCWTISGRSLARK